MRNAISAGVTAVVLSMGYGVWYGHSRSVWDARAEAALEQVVLADARADVLEGLVRDAAANADSLMAAADERARGARERVVVIREVEVPAPCVPFTAVRDTVIDTLIVSVDDWKEAYEEGVTALDFLRLSRDEILLSRDSVVAVLADRPGPREWWVPEVGAGVFTGICTGQQVCSGVGVTFSWKVR